MSFPTEDMSLLVVSCRRLVSPVGLTVTITLIIFQRSRFFTVPKVKSVNGIEGLSVCPTKSQGLDSLIKPTLSQKYKTLVKLVYQTKQFQSWLTGQNGR